MRQTKITIFVVMLLGVSLAYAGMAPAPDGAPVSYDSLQSETKFGDPLPGLTDKELGRFNVGVREFERVHVPEDGLGPTFNQVSCAACHSVPATGGSLADKRDLVIRIGRTDPITGKYDPMTDFGGQVLSRQSVSSFRRSGGPFLSESVCRQPGNVIPVEAEFISFRFGQPLFGLGLIDAISEETILANADPDDRDRDGISGRANMVIGKHTGKVAVGRFGWKAHMVSLQDINSDAYIVEVGITSPDFPSERTPNGRTPREGCDLVPDSPQPEDRIGFSVEGFNDFISFLAPPPRRQLDSSATRGRQIFDSIGCVKCHTPVLMTASNLPSDFRSLANKEAHLFSDLLLHDMGDELADGIEQPEPEFQPKGQSPANGREWRTQPLWGLSAKPFFLHDGRTKDLSTAIILHGGEAQSSRNRFLRISSKDRTDLINFLKSL
jgi:CxxC motif-containing protein (DUF1111 family)